MTSLSNVQDEIRLGKETRQHLLFQLFSKALLKTSRPVERPVVIPAFRCVKQHAIILSIHFIVAFLFGTCTATYNLQSTEKTFAKVPRPVRRISKCINDRS